MIKQSAKLVLGIVVIVTGLMVTRGAYASHRCGSTCNQFTPDTHVCTHGCHAGGAPNPDYHSDPSDQRYYENRNSVPARIRTDGGNYSQAADAVRDFESGNDYVVDDQIHGTTSALEAARINPGSYSATIGPSTGGNPAEICRNAECITFTCSKCGADRRCETGIGENPQFSFGGVGGACSQVDVRSGEGWRVVSLCDPSCSGVYATPDYPTPEYGTPEAGLACLKLKGSSLKPEIGETLKLTCTAPGGGTNVDHFEFRYRVNEEEFQGLAAGTAQRDGGEFVGTSQFKIAKIGNYEVQCRVCKDEAGKKCTSWGKDK